MSLLLKSGVSAELERCVQEKLQRLSTTASDAKVGQRLFANHQLELAPFEAVKFSGWGDWMQDPLNNRSWQWRLNWLSFLSGLLAYHHTSGNSAVLDFASESIRSWLDTFLETDSTHPFEFIWHDHATALRAEQILLFAYYCRDQAPAWAGQHGDFLAYLERALVVHGQWLAKDSFYSEHTNHGLEQARVLLLLGTVFEGEQALAWQEIALRRISSELQFSFTDEGVHVENSPAYHVFVFKVFMGIISEYPASALGDLATQFSQVSAKALNFITYILRPDGKLPPIGDTEQLPTSDAYREMFGHHPEYQQLLYALTHGRQGKRPTILNRVYPKSGYAIFRDQWPTNDNYQLAFHLIVKVGCSSRYHHHQDEGHISLYAGGEDWLIDSGLYNYVKTDPVRRYMRGRSAHNVPLISHARYHTSFAHRINNWQVTDFDENAPKPYLCMKLGVMPPVTHERRVDFDATGTSATVFDRIYADDNESRSIALQWHFPKNKNIVIDNDCVLVNSHTGNRLRITFQGDAFDRISLASGKHKQRISSLTSCTFGRIEESQVLTLQCTQRSSLELATHFQFELRKEAATAQHTLPV
jgi:hypothetical protein